MAKGAYGELHIAIIANSIIMQLLFCFCYLGNRITTKQMEISEAIYDVPWYDFPMEIQKYIKPIMMRSQKPFILTGYSLTNLSLQSFKEVNGFHVKY